MNNTPRMPPPVENRQTYLIQMQQVLQLIREAATAVEILKMRLQSLEAQAKRAAEWDGPKLKAEPDSAVAQEAMIESWFPDAPLPDYPK